MGAAARSVGEAIMSHAAAFRCATRGPPLRSGQPTTPNGRILRENTMSLRRALFALLFGCCAASGAVAQEPPALQGASAQEKARVAALIDGAKKEGALTYWDVVIQPETNDALTAA